MGFFVSRATDPQAKLSCLPRAKLKTVYCDFKKEDAVFIPGLHSLVITLLSLMACWIIPQPVQALSEIHVVSLDHGRAVLPATDSISKIQGESIFIPGHLLSPKDLRLGVPSTHIYLPFPKPWHHIEGQSIFGGGTYLLTLRFPDATISQGRPWGLMFPRNLGPIRIWVDGKLAAERGVVSLDPKKIRYEAGNIQHSFIPQQSEVQIVIQTANFHLHSGGFVWSMFAAPEEKLRTFHLELNLIDGAIGGSLAFSAIYHLWLFTFRRKWRWYLVFGMFFVLMSLRLPFTGASRWGLDFGWNEIFTWKLEYLSFFLMVPINFTAMTWLYPRQVLIKAQRWLTNLSIISCFWVLLTPLWISHLAVRPMQFVAIATILLTLRTLSLAIRDQEPGSTSITLGFLTVMAAGGFDILASFDLIDPHFSVLGPSVAIFAATACIFQAINFERGYRQHEEQTEAISELQGELEQQADVLEESVLRKTEDLQAVLENTDECILILSEVDKQLSISPFASHAAQRLFGKPVINWPDLHQLLLDSQLSSDQCSQLIASIVSSLGSSLLNFEINADCFPQEIRRMQGDEIEAIYLSRWLPLERNDEVSEILVILTDVTAERMVSQKAHLARASTERLLQISTLNPKSFNTFLHEVDNLFERSVQAIRQEGPESWSHLLREIHTIKGLTRNFGLLHLSHDVHVAETSLMSLPADHMRFARAQAVVDSLKESLVVYREQARHIGYLEDEIPHLSTHTQATIYRWGVRLAPKAHERWLEQWQAFLKSHLNSNLELVEVLTNGLNHLAYELDKPLPQVNCLGAVLYLYRGPSEILLGALTHLFRNALDHGIESEMERIRLNKDPVGTINVEWRLGQKLELLLSDDGRGLNLGKIQQRALAKGLTKEGDEHVSDDQVAELIFEQGFSTKDDISAISGRGVGMDAVRTTIHELGGQISIVWSGPKARNGCRPCVWSIELPIELVIGEAAA